MKMIKNKEYYDDLFFKGKTDQWELAPGKSVLLRAIKYDLNEKFISNSSRILE